MSRTRFTAGQTLSAASLDAALDELEALAQGGVTLSASSPAMDGSASAGVAATVSRGDHVHPSDTSRLAAASNLADLANATTARGNLGLTAMAILATAAQGAVVYMGASGPAVLLAGTSGYLLQTNGASSNPTWVPPPAGTGGGASVGSANPLVNGPAAVGVSTFAAHEDHVHPTDTSRAPLDNPAFTTKITLPSYAGNGALPTFATGALAYDTSAGRVRYGSAASWLTLMSVNSDAYVSTPAMNGTGAAGGSSFYARGDHVHPSDTSRLVAASNLSDVANAATARSNLGVAAAGATLSFGLGAVVANGSIPIDIPYGFTLSSMTTNVGTAGGSFAVTVSIGGTPVTGLNAVAVSSSTDSTATATAANTGAAGQALVTIASTTGTPTDSKIILRWTR